MIQAPNGDVLVACTSGLEIVVLRDADNDGEAEKRSSPTTARTSSGGSRIDESLCTRIARLPLVKGTNWMQQKTMQKSALRRAASALQRLFSRGRGEEWTIEAAPEPEKKQPQRAANPVRRQADIPLDLIDRTYTPPLTSSKASFRSDGADHQKDQEFAFGVADERWNDEDHYTNKSGDPRIGTHGRTNEPSETRAEDRE